MKILKLRTSVAVFFLFFGISALEAFRTGNGMKIAFWIAIGILFLIADNMKGKNKNDQVKGKA